VCTRAGDNAPDAEMPLDLAFQLASINDQAHTGVMQPILQRSMTIELLVTYNHKFRFLSDILGFSSLKVVSHPSSFSDEALMFQTPRVLHMHMATLLESDWHFTSLLSVVSGQSIAEPIR